MKQNVVFWIGVKTLDPNLSSKHGNFGYLEYSKRTWQYWCKKNNTLFVEYTEPTDKDVSKHRVTWQRWFDVFDQLDNLNIDYNKIALVDGSSMIRWDTPDIFELTNHNLIASRSLENLRWIYEGISGYQFLFPSIKFDLKKYISCGFQIFDIKHKKFLQILKEYYYSNLDSILDLQKKVDRGTDQPIYNYLLQIHQIDVGYFPAPFHITHMNRFNWFSYNWQLNEDRMPYFIKYGYIWVFSGFDRTQREPLMKQTWDIIKQNYE